MKIATLCLLAAFLAAAAVLATRHAPPHASANAIVKAGQAIGQQMDEIDQIEVSSTLPAATSPAPSTTTSACVSAPPVKTDIVLPASLLACQASQDIGAGREP